MGHLSAGYRVQDLVGGVPGGEQVGGLALQLGHRCGVRREFGVVVSGAQQPEVDRVDACRDEFVVAAGGQQPAGGSGGGLVGLVDGGDVEDLRGAGGGVDLE